MVPDFLEHSVQWGMLTSKKETLQYQYKCYDECCEVVCLGPMAASGRGTWACAAQVKLPGEVQSS